MTTLPWNKDWNDPKYAWPVTSTPNLAAVAAVAARDGHPVADEAHADRSVLMEFPNPSKAGTKYRKQEQRCECRRRAKVKDSMTLDLVCIICDAVHLWPKYVAAAAAA